MRAPARLFALRLRRPACASTLGVVVETLDDSSKLRPGWQGIALSVRHGGVNRAPRDARCVSVGIGGGDASDFNHLSMAELQSKLSALEISFSGSKAQLIRRLQDGLAEKHAPHMRVSAEHPNPVDWENLQGKEVKRLHLTRGCGIRSGDHVEALPGAMWKEHGAVYFQEGSRGVVTDIFNEDNDSIACIQITWIDSQLVTHFSLDDWKETFLLVDNGSVAKEQEEDGSRGACGRNGLGDDTDLVGFGPGSPSWNRQGMQFFVGDMVEARRPRGDGPWYPARCAKNHGDFTYNVKWDSDALEERRHVDEIRKPQDPEKTPTPGWIDDWWPLD
eukprot:TRINITY_DN45374_c0_g1_i1.p1 TRINITY_DN45374_c0_g1~~TRINITY_DN45374_c0_g1_i1.p1  ORF type:complete len:332 (-),score=46.08 TRINITY_DN45374_c0_g1_i1:38-1033(-)